MSSAHELLAARAARIRRIRQRVIAGTVAAFALAWGIVAWDGSTGSTHTTAQATTTTESTDTPTSAEETYETDDSSTLSTSQS